MNAVSSVPAVAPAVRPWEMTLAAALDTEALTVSGVADGTSMAHTAPLFSTGSEPLMPGVVSGVVNVEEPFSVTPRLGAATGPLDRLIISSMS